MARTVAEIQKQILDNIAADVVLGPLLTSTSKRAIYRLYAYVIAVAIGVFEQILDVFTVQTEGTVAKGAPASFGWLQSKILEFQYSDDVPQIPQLIDFAPSYPVVDPSLRIISRVSITSDISNNVLVRVATGTPPVALSAPQLAALQSYITIIGAGGITYIGQSGDADKLYVQADIYYSGLYSSVIKANVITAIDTYLANLDFGGNVKISDLELTVKSVVGVTDVVLKNVRARKDNIVFANGTFLVQNNATIGRLWPTQAGYIVQETTVGQTFNDTLNFISE